ncbi:MAG: FG-GAP repeat protein, partial [Candidatus Eisenbacteria bacterium]|nr:FG-GAP repeat protein [Candidatus Eisenbacteria bacterium]
MTVLASLASLDAPTFATPTQGGAPGPIRYQLLLLFAVTLVASAPAIGNGQCQVAELTAPDLSYFGNEMFGYSLGFDGERIIVGALGADGASFHTGAAYIFVQDQGVWVLEQKVFPSSTGFVGLAGIDVDIDGDVAIVSDLSTASVTVFRRVAGVWTEEATIVSPPDFSQYGRFIALDGDRVVVCDYFANGGLGRLFIYRYDGTDWALEYEPALPALPGAQFGHAFAVDGDRVVVAAPQTDPAGAVFIYDYDPTSGWQETILEGEVGEQSFGQS